MNWAEVDDFSTGGTVQRFIDTTQDTTIVTAVWNSGYSSGDEYTTFFRTDTGTARTVTTKGKPYSSYCGSGSTGPKSDWA